ncbi:MAG: hypothetical protein MI922_12855 [Bacteroidales bacterium]|nr:hypothetical protein [Bacteroidales bacterium]
MFAVTTAQFEPPLVKAEHNTYFSNLKLFSQIKQRNDFDYELISGTVSTNRFKIREIHFHPNGAINEIINLSKIGKKKSIIVFGYDRRFLPLSETEYLPTGEKVGRVKYKYNINGTLEEKSFYNQYGYIVSKIVYSTIADSNVIIEKEYHSPEKVSRYRYIYYTDLENGKRFQEKEYDANHEEVVKKSISYNEFGKISEVSYYRHNNLEYKLFYSYDKNKNLTQVLREDNEGARREIEVYNYNDTRLLVGELKKNPLGRTIMYKKYTYF